MCNAGYDGNGETLCTGTIRLRSVYLHHSQSFVVLLACTGNTFSTVGHPCRNCLASAQPNSNHSGCICNPGLTGDGITSCVACLSGYFCVNGEATQCPAPTSSIQSASSELDCLCTVAGQFGGGRCSNCTAGFICTGDGLQTPCPQGSTSAESSSSVFECVCDKPGYFGTGGCTACSLNCESCNSTETCRACFRFVFRVAVVQS